MPDAPLSRRARRTFEEEAADRAALEDSTSAIAQAPTSDELQAAESERTAVLSRRDRRRLERLNHPLEAWTAEEEMIATGQIPVMTPERIAEQERISREKAARAAEEAVAASQELRRLQAPDIWQEPNPVPEEQASPQVPEPAAQPQWAEEPPTDFPDDFEYAAKPSWTEEPAPQGETPAGTAVPEFHEADPVADQSGDGDAADVPAADEHESRPVLEPYQPVMALDQTPLVPVVHRSHEDAVVTTHEQDADEQSTPRSAAVDAPFATGSNQTALRHQDPFAASSPDEHAPAESGHMPTLLPPQEMPERATNPVDEIRRLAAEAMSGIERASKTDEEADTAAPVRSPDPSENSEFDALQSAWDRQEPAPDGGDSAAAQPPATQPEQPAPAITRPLADFAWGEEAGSSPSATRADGGPSFDSLGDWSQRMEPAPSTPPDDVESQHSEFDQLTQPSSGSTRAVAPASGQFPMPDEQGEQPQPQPASGEVPMPGQQGEQPQPQPAAPQGPAGPQGPAWDSQPLNAESGRPAEAPSFTPLSDVPKPDFSGLYKQGSPAAFPPLTGAINTAALNSAEFHGGDMTASGQVPVIRRPELPEVGGVKHFKWVHLSVIGALMFVLGVVIYNVAFNR